MILFIITQCVREPHTNFFNMSGSQSHSSLISDGSSYIYQIPTMKLKELCRILERQNIWTELAAQMGYSPIQSEVNTILFLNSSTTSIRIPYLQHIVSMACKDNNSLSEELLIFWGEQNHTVMELFSVLYL